MHYDYIIVGGGAAGYFCAANLQLNSNQRVAILEKGRESLAKVKVSGGGRCNVTHACFQNSKLLKNYPRGSKFLKKGFNIFSCQDTVDWFAGRGVPLKTEADGRMFPSSNSSQTIIDCLSQSIPDKVDLLHSTDVVNIQIQDNNAQKFIVDTKSSGQFTSQYLILATGSNTRMWGLLSTLGHDIIKPVPSLFTFHIDDERINDLQGLSVSKAIVRLSGEKLINEGPLLITHWGTSGPAILKLSAFGARVMSDKSYKFEIEINWTGIKQKHILHELEEMVDSIAAKLVLKNAQFGIPSRLWERLCAAAGIQEHMRYRDINQKNKLKLTAQLGASRFNVTKKSTFKEEFVTAGGIDTGQINALSFESKLVPGLFMAGEMLNIDAVTGGFNFQAAWTGGYLIAETLNKLDARH